MGAETAKAYNVPEQEYWRYFEKLIVTADTGTTLATLGWIFFWLDHIPDHFLHTHMVTGFIFLASLSFGLAGARVMLITRNRLGTRSNRVFHILKISYSILASALGLFAFFRFPPL